MNDLKQAMFANEEASIDSEITGIYREKKPLKV